MEHCRKLRLFRAALVTVCLLASVGFIQAETITVKGTVTSASDGEPLVGVTVQVKGTSNGTTTDFDGNYSITAETGRTLLFSYVGMTPQEHVVKDARLDVALLDNSAVLDEVVVVGYGVQKKKLVTGATAQIKGDDIAKLNTNSPLQAMQGQLPGVNITSTSGQPGSSMKVRIRGLGTVGNADPLYLIDGVGGDISTLNPADIESIDVLKDAASAAIYGAQAANGVVLITTKKGAEGSAKVTFDAYYGWQSVARKAQMLNSQQYMAIMDEQQVNSGLAPYDWSSIKSAYHTDADGNSVLNNTDWINSMIKNNVPTSSYTLGISGGSKASTYAMSVGYLNQQGVIGGKDVSNYSRYNFRVNSDHKLFDGIVTVGEQASFIYVTNTGIAVGNQYSNTLRGAFNSAPITPIYDANGDFNSTTNSDWNINEGNPYGNMMLNTNNRNKNATFSGNVYAQIEPIKNLRVKTVFGAVYGSSEYRSYTPIYEFSPYSYSTITKVNQNMNHSLGMTWTNTASYDWKIGLHAFNALVGMEAYRYSGMYLGGGQDELKEGFDDWYHAYISNGTGSTIGENNVSVSGYPHDKSRSVSYFGRLGWDYNEKYMINATLRSDGSSKFAKGHRFGYFPSVSAGWNISNESFMESTNSWLSYLKIRGSWGRVGNQNIDNYQYLAPIKVTNTHYLFGQYMGAGGTLSDYASNLATNWGAYPSRLGNYDLTWETSEQTDFGFDARLLNNRLAVNFDYYIKNTKDWLVVAPILATAGTDAPYINGGNVKNSGVELNLTWNDNIADFAYSVGVNGAYNKNKVGSIPNEDGIIHGDTGVLFDNSLEFYRATNGHPIGFFWGYKTAGIFQNEKQITDWITAGNGVLQSDVQPGDVIYVDVNHDGVINDDDKVDLGNGTPKFTFGFNINLYYKNFDLGIIATGAAGYKIVQSYRSQTSQYSNYTTRILDRWTGEGTSNTIPRVTNTNINWQFSDLYLQNGDYLRLSNLTLGYNFAPLINKKWCSQCRVYFQAQNLLTFTKYDGMDPEIGYGTSTWVSGIDLGYYPRPRTYMFGVNLAF
jgi:TonB-linked SusC/RagA family outer membrane protein